MAEKQNTPVIRFEGFTDPWEQRKLGEVGEIYTGNTPATDNPIYYSNDGIPWITPSDIVDFNTPKPAKYLSEVGLKVGRTVPAGSIMCTCIASIGKNTITSTTCGFNQQINALVPNKEQYDSNFLFAESYLWSQTMKRDAAEGTMQIVNKSEFSELNILKPSLIEQQAIGSFFSRLDHLITLHQRKHEKLCTVKKSMLDKMFPKPGETEPEIRFEGFTDPWEQRKLGEFGSVAMCKRIYKEQTSEQGDVPFFKIGTFGADPDAFISNELFDYFKRTYPYPTPGTLLISAAGSIGRVVEYQGEKAYFQDSNIVWLEHDHRLNDTFLKSLYSQIEWGLEGSTIKRLYNKDLLSAEVTIPGSGEQKEIGRFFAKLDDLITLHQRKLDLLKNMKKSLLDKMFV